MKLICYPTTAEPPVIRPAALTRRWMDETGEKFAYRCLPLNIANAHAWEILSPSTFVARWSGDMNVDGVVIETDDPPNRAPQSHFGNGVLTFEVPAIFRTEPGWDLFVTGPLNSAKDGLSPLSAVIETDWSPYTFTMNWRFTRRDKPVIFKEGEPFCAFFPVLRRAAETVEPEFRALDSDPELAARHRAWSASRQRFNADLKAKDAEALAQGWQRTYFHGQNPDGAPGPEDHCTRLRLRPFAEDGK